MKTTGLSLIFLFLLVGCTTPLPKIHSDGHLIAGDFHISSEISFQWRQRTTFLHIPPGLNSSDSHPLVIVLHGAFSTGEKTALETGFNDLADQEHFLVAYPEGIGLFGWLQHWNAGHCCGKAADDKIDDIGFVMSVVDKLSRELPVDPSRIYLAGMSNGGMLAYRILAEQPERFAAAAVVAGAISSRLPDVPEQKLPNTFQGTPLVIFHGDADQHIPPAGGTSPLGRGERSYSSLKDATEFWQRANGCSGENDERTLREGGLRQVRVSCRQDLEIWQLADWGHQWPGQHFTMRLSTDNPLYGFNATAEIWQFFRRQVQPTGIKR